MRTPYVAVLAAFLLAACGSESSGGDPKTGKAPAARPTEVPAAEGEVTTRYPVMVIDDGSGAELCLGGVATSLPPQCGGPPLPHWDWAALDGGFEEQSGTRWGEFVVIGAFDGSRSTPSEVVPAARRRPLPDPAEEDSFRRRHAPSPKAAGSSMPSDDDRDRDGPRVQRCEEPVRPTGDPGSTRSINPVADEEPSGIEWEIAMSDPSNTIVNVAVTDDLAGAEAAIRDVWGGPLCVSEAIHTDRELRRARGGVLRATRLLRRRCLGTTTSSAYVLHDDGSIQAWVDQEYGEGVVAVSSALVPIDD